MKIHSVPTKINNLKSKERES